MKCLINMRAACIGSTKIPSCLLEVVYSAPIDCAMSHTLLILERFGHVCYTRLWGMNDSTTLKTIILKHDIYKYWYFIKSVDY